LAVSESDGVVGRPPTEVFDGVVTPPCLPFLLFAGTGDDGVLLVAATLAATTVPLVETGKVSVGFDDSLLDSSSIGTTSFFDVAFFADFGAGDGDGGDGKGATTAATGAAAAGTGRGVGDGFLVGTGDTTVFAACLPLPLPPPGDAVTDDVAVAVVGGGDGVAVGRVTGGGVDDAVFAGDDEVALCFGEGEAGGGVAAAVLAGDGDGLFGVGSFLLPPLPDEDEPFFPFGCPDICMTLSQSS
jgi:hypothetical protein